jgi:hypothetical protein
MLTALQGLLWTPNCWRSRLGVRTTGKREVDEVDWQGSRVYLHLGVRQDEPLRG